MIRGFSISGNRQGIGKRSCFCSSVFLCHDTASKGKGSEMMWIRDPPVKKKFRDTRRIDIQGRRHMLKHAKQFLHRLITSVLAVLVAAGALFSGAVPVHAADGTIQKRQRFSRHCLENVWMNLNIHPDIRFCQVSSWQCTA